MLRVDYMRENDPLLAHQGVPKSSQLWKYFLYYMTRKCIWFINELKTGWFIPGTLRLYEISSQFMTHVWLTHLGDLVWFNEVNQPIQLGERVWTNNSVFYLYRSLLFREVHWKDGLVFGTVWK